jgi:arylsulfatase
VEIQQTDHLVRKGAAGLGAIGFVVGLFAPPLLAATAIGAAIGAGAGRLLHNSVAAKLQEQVESTIRAGGAGMIRHTPHSSAREVEAAATRAVSRLISQAEGSQLKDLRAAIADTQAKMTGP